MIVQAGGIQKIIITDLADLFEMASQLNEVQLELAEEGLIPARDTERI